MKLSTKELVVNQELEKKYLSEGLLKYYSQLKLKKAKIKSNLDYCNRIKNLYYLTTIKHVKSIIKYGILPRNEAFKKGLIRKDISDSEIQEKRKQIKFRLADYKVYSTHDLTNFYFAYDTPSNYRMCEKDREVVLICVSKDIFDSKNHMFAFTDSHLISKRKPYQNFKDLEKLPWDIIEADFSDYGNDERKRVQKMAEFFIYPKVEPQFIEKIIAPTEGIYEYVKGIARTSSKNIKVIYNRNVFKKINNKVFY